MLATLLIALGVLAPIAYLVYNQMHANTPSLRWPKLAPMLKLNYVARPVSMEGKWNGRDVSVVLLDNGVAVSAKVNRVSRLRVEVAAKDVVTQRAGMVVPDPVATNDPAFDDRLLARCSDKALGPAVFDAVLRQRLLSHPHVDIVGMGDNVKWLAPSANDPDRLEGMLEILGVLATEMERLPA